MLCPSSRASTTSLAHVVDAVEVVARVGLAEAEVDRLEERLRERRAAEHRLDQVVARAGEDALHLVDAVARLRHQLERASTGRPEPGPVVS